MRSKTEKTGVTRSVLVYRQNYAVLSETFVSDHIRSLTRFRPIVVTERRANADHRPQDVPVVELGRSRLERALRNRLGMSYQFHNLLQREDIGVVHAHFLVDAARLLPLLQHSPVPFVITAHGYDATLDSAALCAFEEGRVLVKRTEWLRRRATRIVCVSDFIRDELIRRGYPEDKLVTIPLGVDIDILKARGPGVTGRGIVAVGRLVEKKGMQKLIEAYALLPPQLRADQPLTIVGDGPLRASLEEQARNAGVVVSFAGSIPRSEVLVHMKAAAVFCLPSIRARNGDAEGMPVSIMEALALSVPVAIFDDQPIADRFAREGAGATAAAGSGQALAQTLNRVLSDKAFAAQLSSRGRRFCENNFSLQRNTAVLEDLYDSLSGPMR